MRTFLLVILVLFSLNAQDKSKVSLDLRVVYVNYDFDNYWEDSEAFVTSVKLGYKDYLTDTLEAGIVFGGIEDFGLSNPNKQSMTYIFNRDNDTFALLHQAYLKYNFNNSYIQAGRFEFQSPLIDSDDYFVLSNSFEGAIAEINFNKSKINIGHIQRMSGTWDAGYDGGEFVSMTKSPWLHKADNQEVNQWPNPVVDFGLPNRGITFGAFTYTDEQYKFQIWDYYAYDLMNSVYTQADISFEKFDLAFQYNTFDDVGDIKNVNDPRAVINYSVWGAKISTDISDMKWTLGYIGVSDTESAHLWGSWGGYPYFASGMMVSYFDTSLRDANIYALSSDFSMINNLSTTLHIGYYDLNPAYTIDTRGDRNAVNGESAMYTYGISNSYQYDQRLSFLFKLAGRTLPDSSNSATYLRFIAKYQF